MPHDPIARMRLVRRANDLVEVVRDLRRVEQAPTIGSGPTTASGSGPIIDVAIDAAIDAAITAAIAAAVPPASPELLDDAITERWHVYPDFAG